MPAKSKERQMGANRNGRKASSSNGGKVALVLSGERMIDPDLPATAESPRPHQLNPESKEDREKRLAKRKALTLKAFSIAYKNQHPRKAS